MATVYKQRCTICGHTEEALNYWIAAKKLTEHTKKHKETQ